MLCTKPPFLSKTELLHSVPFSICADFSINKRRESRTFLYFWSSRSNKRFDNQGVLSFCKESSKRRPSPRAVRRRSVPKPGLEPGRAFEFPQDFKSCASANSATSASFNVSGRRLWLGELNRKIVRCPFYYSVADHCTLVSRH